MSGFGLAKLKQEGATVWYDRSPRQELLQKHADNLRRDAVGVTGDRGYALERAALWFKKRAMVQA